MFSVLSDSASVACEDSIKDSAAFFQMLLESVLLTFSFGKRFTVSEKKWQLDRQLEQEEALLDPNVIRHEYLPLCSCAIWEKAHWFKGKMQMRKN